MTYATKKKDLPPMNPMPIAIGATLATILFIGESVPVFFKSPINLVQSSSLTSCVMNGCGCTWVGGGSIGNPLSNPLPRLIATHGGKGEYGN